MYSCRTYFLLYKVCHLTERLISFLPFLLSEVEAETVVLSQGTDLLHAMFVFPLMFRTSEFKRLAVTENGANSSNGPLLPGHAGIITAYLMDEVPPPKFRFI